MATATATKTNPPVKPQKAPQAPVKATPLKTPVTVKPLLMGTGNFDFVMHREGCKAYATQKKKSQYAGVEPEYTIEGINNQIEVIREVWDDQIRESYTDDAKAMAKSDDYATASWAWLKDNGFVTSVSFHTCLDGLPQTAKGTASKTSTTTTKKAAKNELATLVAEAAGKVVADILEANMADPENASALLIHSGFKGDADIAQTVAQWLHGMPVYRERFLAVLPRPDRSDWRAELDAANSTPDPDTDTDTDSDDEAS